MTRVAVLDDWQRIAEKCADWSGVRARAELVFFHDPFADEHAAAAALGDFDVLVAMRERTEFPARLIEMLPKLRMISQTGGRARTLDIAACTARGVLVCNTGGGAQYATAELALGLMLAAFRRIAQADAGIRAGRFQDGIAPGIALEGRTLGVIGLGRLGGRMARYGQALGMRVLAWSPNLSEARARDGGAEYARARPAAGGIGCGEPAPGAFRSHARDFGRAGAWADEAWRGAGEHVARAAGG